MVYACQHAEEEEEMTRTHADEQARAFGLLGGLDRPMYSVEVCQLEQTTALHTFVQEVQCVAENPLH